MRTIRPLSSENTALDYREIEELKPEDEGDPSNIDNILRKIVGPCGLWQIMIIIVACISIPSTVTFPVFANNQPKYRCKMEQDVESAFLNRNLTFDQIAIIIGPWYQGNERGEHKASIGCYRFNREWNRQYAQNISSSTPANSTSGEHDLNIEACPMGYVYEPYDYQYPDSVVAEFNTVCDQEWLTPLSTSIYLVGMGIGYIFGGWSGGKFGRKRTTIAFWLMESLGFVAIFFSRNYTIFAMGRMVVACAATGRITVLSVLRVETTLAQYRYLLSAIASIIQGCIFRGTVSLMAYLIPNWRWLHAAIMIPTMFGFLYFILPESPRWLVSQMRIKEAICELQKAHKMNRFCGHSPASSEEAELYFARIHRFLDNSNHQDKDDGCTYPIKLRNRVSGSFRLEIVKNRKIWKTLILSMILVTGHVMCFYGVFFYSSFTRTNIYLANYLNTLMSLPGVVIFSLSYRYFDSRRLPIVAIYLLTSIILTISYLITYLYGGSSDIVLTVCANGALILLGAVFDMIFVYIPELFPSSIRSQGFGTVSGVGRFGPVGFTFVNQYLQHYSHGSPMLFYAGVLFLELFVIWMMDDTSGENLANNLIPQTLVMSGAKRLDFPEQNEGSSIDSSA